jgi:RNA recognition motif-containing protein
MRFQVIMRDKQSGLSRGFGFVTYIDPQAAERVLAMPALELRGRKLDCKLAVPKVCATFRVRRSAFD